MCGNVDVALSWSHKFKQILVKMWSLYVWDRSVYYVLLGKWRTSAHIVHPCILWLFGNWVDGRFHQTVWERVSDKLEFVYSEDDHFAK